MSVYIIYCDESVKGGPYYSHFYGGTIVDSKDLNHVIQRLNDVKKASGFNGEIKWTKVSPNYLKGYIAVIDEFFNIINENKIRVRIMFTHNVHEPTGLTKAQKEKEFFLLYYQFIKHAFGLMHCNNASNCSVTYFRLFFDRLPDREDKRKEFKQFIGSMETTREFKSTNLRIRPEDIGEVNSHNHTILQCTDIVLGAMQFRLNNLHKEKPPGKRMRGKRTIAKECLYKHILKRIREMRPNFNIGISTGIDGDLTKSWSTPYAHWNFVPKNCTYNDRYEK